MAAPAAASDNSIHQSTTANPVDIQSSPKCSGTGNWGKIRYQVCFQYNCDSTRCFARGYLGLINTATSSRTVYWELRFKGLDGILYNDDSGVASLAAGQQRTIYSDSSFQYEPCGARTQHTEYLRVNYDSAGWSPYVSTNDTLYCV